MVAKGMTAKEIGQALKMSPRSIDGDIAKLRARLKARDRAHLVTRALQAKEITLAELVQ